MLRSRLKEEMNKLAFEYSLSKDEKIFYYDILVDIAHVLGLLKCGHISEGDARSIIKALIEVRDAGYNSLPTCEDVHEAIEYAVTKKTEAGKKMHTARSRNDEVATCLRMFARDRLLSLAYSLLELREVLLKIAEENIDVIMPGFTHLQYAQPTKLSHHIIAYHDMLERDFKRVVEVFRRVNLCPLGCSAFASTSFKLDRFYVAELLGFDGIVENCCDGVSSRDFLIESVFVATSVMLSLSRIAEEIVLWCSEFNFIELPDEFASTSSVMPQKKNPDIAELIRARTGKLIGNLTAVATIYKAMPFTYNRDFQEMNNILFESLEIAEKSVIVMARMLEKIKFNKEIMLEKVFKNYTYATEVADSITKAGVPFRDSHKIVGRLIRDRLELNAKNIKKVAKELGYDIEVKIELDPEKIVEDRRNIGGTSKEEIERMINVRKEKLDNDWKVLAELIENVCKRLERLYDEFKNFVTSKI